MIRRAVEVERWTDFACAGGQAVSLLDVADGTFDESLVDDQGAQLELAGEAARGLALREVLRITDDLDVVREYRVTAIREPWGSATVAVQASAVEQDLTTRGYVRVSQGGATQYRVGGLLLLREWITTYLESNRAEDGLSWLSFATPADDTVPRALSVEGVSRLQLVRELCRAFQREFRLERLGESGYRGHFEAAVGATAPVVAVAQGRNLAALVRERADRDFATAIRPIGATVPGTTEPATIGEMAYEITAITGSVAPFWIELRDRMGMGSPVAFDGQWVDTTTPFVLLTRTGTTVAITGSRASDGAVSVGATAGLVVGEDVGLLRNAAGQRCALVVHQVRETQTPRVVRPDAADGVRGERNYVLNPRFGRWSGALADGWTNRTPAVEFRKFDNAAPVTVAGAVNGAVTASLTVALDGLPASTTYRAGHWVLFGGSTRRWLAADATTDGAGAVTVTLGTTITVADNVAITIQRPTSSPAAASASSLFLPTQVVADDTIGIDCPAITLASPLVAAYTRAVLHVHVDFVSNVTQSFDPTNGPRARLRDATGVATPPTDGGAMSDWSILTGSLNPGDIASRVLQAVFFLGAATSVQARVQPPRAGETRWHSGLLVHGVSITLGTHTDEVPLYEGASPNQLVDRANRLLREVSGEPAAIELSLSDLSTVVGYEVAAESLVLGGTIAAEDVDVSARILGITRSLVDPRAVRVRLAQRSDALSRLLSTLT